MCLGGLDGGLQLGRARDVDEQVGEHEGLVAAPARAQAGDEEVRALPGQACHLDRSARRRAGERTGGM